jgi:hypothetical protein
MEWHLTKLALNPPARVRDQTSRPARSVPPASPERNRHAALFPHPAGLPCDRRCGFTIRALQTGIVYGRNWTPYNRDEQPGMFASLMFARLVGISICLWLAAGYTLDNFLAPLGLSGFIR